MAHLPARPSGYEPEPRFALRPETVAASLFCYLWILAPLLMSLPDFAVEARRILAGKHDKRRASAPANLG